MGTLFSGNISSKTPLSSYKDLVINDQKRKQLYFEGFNITTSIRLIKKTLKRGKNERQKENKALRNKKPARRCDDNLNKWLTEWQVTRVDFQQIHYSFLYRFFPQLYGKRARGSLRREEKLNTVFKIMITCLVCWNKLCLRSFLLFQFKFIIIIKRGTFFWCIIFWVVLHISWKNI